MSACVPEAKIYRKLLLAHWSRLANQRCPPDNVDAVAHDLALAEMLDDIHAMLRRVLEPR